MSGVYAAESTTGMPLVLVERSLLSWSDAISKVFSLSTNGEAATESASLFAISSLRPKMSVSALKTRKGQTRAELAPVKSNMLFCHAERGKGEQREGGKRRVWKVLCCSVVPGEL